MSKVALCIDSESIVRPQAIGLPDESLQAQAWLKLLCSAQEARDALRQDAGLSCDQVWVVSCDDMEPVNLAAALKADSPQRPVLLVNEDFGGSVRSCAAKAGIDQVIDLAELAKCYAQRKRDFGAKAAKEQKVRPLLGNDSPASQAAASAPEGPARRSGTGLGGEEAEAAGQRLLRSADLSGLDVPAGQPKAFFLPVVSGSGGAGKSTVAVLAALLTQRAGLRTLLVDFDLQFGDLDALLGCSDAMGVDDVARSPMRTSQLAPANGQPAFLKAPVRLEDAEQLANRIPAIMDALSGGFDVIVANTGGFWTEIQAQLLERSSKALFLIDQRPSSLRACRRALDLCARCGIAASPFVFAPNRCSKGGLYTSIDVSCTLHGATSFELAEGGEGVEEALAEGRPQDLLEEGNDLVQSLDQLLRQIMPPYAAVLERSNARARKPGLWRRLGFGRRKEEASGYVAERESA